MIEEDRLIGGENFNYEYDKVQMLLNSDRLTFNARKDSIFLSSFQHIHMGAGQTLNIKTNGETIIDSSNIFNTFESPGSLSLNESSK